MFFQYISVIENYLSNIPVQGSSPTIEGKPVVRISNIQIKKGLPFPSSQDQISR
jgi:hypothetical protein